MNRLRIAARALGLLIVAIESACSGPSPNLPGSSELEQLSVRTMQGEVVDALPAGPREAGEGILKGHRLDRYFVDGGWVEVLWVEPPGGIQPGADPRRTLNPVIFWYEGLDGWGWDHFDQRAEEWGLREPIEVPGSEEEGDREAGPGPEAGEGVSA